eukprot:CAMPEP_0170253148 /NCGR_PEP_ID=MMETSP0116_2-20130129/26412_1 /TAXON_ID=400756 /ORGANISM="Durinskia baltica, Strain CSIRO CS-38" /LENGTH=208 /DNA_ID=CAMNT_0010504127 /DNA_START=71 /DNA_END=693 /DNA_ORIENTATION=-
MAPFIGVFRRLAPLLVATHIAGSTALGGMAVIRFEGSGTSADQLAAAAVMYGALSVGSEDAGHTDTVKVDHSEAIHISLLEGPIIIHDRSKGHGKRLKGEIQRAGGTLSRWRKALFSSQAKDKEKDKQKEEKAGDSGKRKDQNNNHNHNNNSSSNNNNKTKAAADVERTLRTRACERKAAAGVALWGSAEVTPAARQTCAMHEAVVSG